MNSGATKSEITGFNIAEAEKLIVSVTTPSALIVSTPLNEPAVVGANFISTEPNDSFRILNPSPSSTTSTLLALATEYVAVPLAVSPT